MHDRFCKTTNGNQNIDAATLPRLALAVSTCENGACLALFKQVLSRELFFRYLGKQNNKLSQVKFFIFLNFKNLLKGIKMFRYLKFKTFENPPFCNSYTYMNK